MILCKILFNTKACELFNNFWRSLNNLQCNEFMLGHLKGETTILYSLYMYVFSLKLQSFERALYIWVFSARIKKLPDCKYLAKASSVALKSAFFVFGFKLLRLKILLLNFKFMIYIYCELWWLITLKSLNACIWSFLHRPIQSELFNLMNRTSVSFTK